MSSAGRSLHPGAGREGTGLPSPGSPRTTPLSRTELVKAASDFVEEQGVEQLTIRRLAQRLQVTPMALYKHVASKEELLVAVVDGLMAECGEPRRHDPSDPGDWERWLRDHARQLRDFMVAHGAIVRLIITPPMVGAGSLRLLELTVTVLEEAGFAPGAAAAATTLFNNMIIGTALWDIWRAGYASSLQARVTDDTVYYWPFDYRLVDRDAFPRLASLAEQLNAQKAADHFEIHLTAVLSTIRSRFAP